MKTIFLISFLILFYSCNLVSQNNQDAAQQAFIQILGECKDAENDSLLPLMKKEQNKLTFAVSHPDYGELNIEWNVDSNKQTPQALKTIIKEAIKEIEKKYDYDGVYEMILSFKYKDGNGKIVFKPKCNDFRVTFLQNGGTPDVEFSSEIQNCSFSYNGKPLTFSENKLRLPHFLVNNNEIELNGNSIKLLNLNFKDTLIQVNLEVPNATKKTIIVVDSVTNNPINDFEYQYYFKDTTTILQNRTSKKNNLLELQYYENYKVSYLLIIKHRNYDDYIVRDFSNLPDTIKLVCSKVNVSINFLSGHGNYKMGIENVLLQIKKNETFTLTDGILPESMKGYWSIIDGLPFTPQKDTTITVNVKRITEDKTIKFNISGVFQKTDYVVTTPIETKNGSISQNGYILQFRVPKKFYVGEKATLILKKPKGYNITFGNNSSDWQTPTIVVDAATLNSPVNLKYEKIPDFNLVYVASRETQINNTQIAAILKQKINSFGSNNFLLFVSSANNYFRTTSASTAIELPSRYTFPNLEDDFGRMKGATINGQLVFDNLKPSRQYVRFYFYLTESSYGHFSYQNILSTFLNHFTESDKIEINIITNFNVLTKPNVDNVNYTKQTF